MTTTIPVTANLAIREDEIQESFVRASGPGGQHVNTTASAVQLRFDVRNSPSLPPPVRDRLEALAGQRLSNDGVLTIMAQGHRSQILNRRDALERLIALIRQATVRPVVRRPTRPTLGSKQRRLASKTRRSEIKGMRRDKGHND